MSVRFCTTAAQFQTALDVCVAGDIISLDHTVTFTGNFVIKNRGVIPDNNRIIIEGDGAVASLPAPGYRIKPAVHSTYLVKIQGTQTQSLRTTPAIRFDNGANGYYLRFLELLPAFWGDGEQISVGINDITYNQYSDQPYNVTIDRCSVHGGRLTGQKRGIGGLAKNLTIINCDIRDHTGVSQDTMSIGIVNGEGPLTIINNYIRGGGFSFITAGSDPEIRTDTTVVASPAPTSTRIYLTDTTDLSVGQMISVLYTDGLGTLRRKHPYVTALNVVTGQVDFADIGVVADVPGDVTWGIQLRNITVRRNHICKDPDWQTPILSTPAVSTNIVTAAGLAAGTYYYRVQAKMVGGGYQNITYYSSGSTEFQAVFAVASQVQLSWLTIADATAYRIHRYQKDGTGAIINMVYFETSSLTFTDVGAAGTSIAGLLSASKWNVKNNFELKTGTNVQVDSNIFEYSWKGSDLGYSIWLKNNNQSLNHSFSQCRDIVWEKNIHRHIGGWLSISGIRSTGELPKDNTEEMKNVVFRNNLIYDSSTLYMEGNVIYGTSLGNGPQNVTFDHNTIIHDAYGAMQMVYNANKGYCLNLLTKNNIQQRRSFGYWGSNAPFAGEGKSAVLAHTNNTGDMDHVVLAAASAGTYAFTGRTNYFPSEAALELEFKNYGGTEPQDYKLKRISEGDASDSTYLNAGTDGKDIGADINLIMTATSGVIDGIPEGFNPEVRVRVRHRIRPLFAR